MNHDDPFFEFDERKLPPLQPGWYPTLVCWDVEEGQYPDATRWLGDKWATWAVRYYMPVRCETDQEAEAYADRCEPDWSRW